MKVQDIQFVHRACITPGCIVARKRLAEHARRAGYEGCMLDLSFVPATGRVEAITAGHSLRQEEIEAHWAVADRLLLAPSETRSCDVLASAQGTVRLAVERKRQPPRKASSWSADVLRIVEQLPHEFRLTDVYDFADGLAARYPSNSHVRPKIRQQLQVLRDLGFLAFTDQRGVYRRIPQQHTSQSEI